MKNAIAVVDAAVVHGASRFYRGVHLKPREPWDRNYKLADDRFHFLEFLHHLVLYDCILMDWSCSLGSIPPDLEEFLRVIKNSSRDPLIEREGLAPHSHLELRAIAKSTCRLIGASTTDHEKRDNLISLKLPWAYTVGHHDYEMFTEVAIEQNLDPILIPFALFTFRGLCYAGYANNYARKKAPAVYIASPGRLAALEKTIASNDLKKIEFARRAYRDLVDILKLPDAGYDFSDFGSFYPHETSSLALAVEEMSARDALVFAIKQRSTREGFRLRREWGERIWQSSQSAAFGPRNVVHQNMDNIRSIFGNITQVIYASPANA